jgi:hypothetical protein
MHWHMQVSCRSFVRPFMVQACLQYVAPALTARLLHSLLFSELQTAMCVSACPQAPARANTQSI